MDNNILVTYASWTGSTADVAEAIGQGLRNGHTTVDVLPAREMLDLSPYCAVVVGSAIRRGQVHPDAMVFLELHQEALVKVPVAYFIVCLTMKDDSEESRRRVAAYVDRMRQRVPQVQPVDVGLFAGVLNYSKLSQLTALEMKRLNMPEGDFRDWQAIRDWAISLRLRCAGATAIPSAQRLASPEPRQKSWSEVMKVGVTAEPAAPPICAFDRHGSD